MNKIDIVISAPFLLYATFVAYRNICFRSTARALRGGLEKDAEREMSRARSIADFLPGLDRITAKAIYVVAILTTLVSVGFRLGWLVGPTLWLWVSAICFPVLSRTPPGVLLLSNSGAEQVGLHLRIKVALARHRVVALLDMRQGGIGNWDLNALYFDVFRTDQFPKGVLHTSWETKGGGDQSGWRQVMHLLADLSLIIVLDARNCSPAVLEETEWCLMQERRNKVLIVSDEDGRTPVLDVLGVTIREQLKIVPESRLIDRLREAFRSRNAYLSFLDSRYGYARRDDSDRCGFRAC